MSDQKMKERFEAWAKSLDLDLSAYDTIEPATHYVDDPTTICWMAYRAGAESQSEREAWERGVRDARNAECQGCRENWPLHADFSHTDPKSGGFMICQATGIRALAYPGDEPPQGGLELCQKPTKYHLIAGASSYACMLTKGHEGECQPGGECFVHGRYVGSTQCPQCVESAAGSAAPACAMCGSNMVKEELGWYCNSCQPRRYAPAAPATPDLETVKRLIKEAGEEEAKWPKWKRESAAPATKPLDAWMQEFEKLLADYAARVRGHMMILDQTNATSAEKAKVRLLQFVGARVAAEAEQGKEPQENL